MKALRWLTCALAVTGASTVSSSMAAAGQAPAVRVESQVVSGVARFSLWYQDPSQAWANSYNQAGGWMVVVYMAPSQGPAGLEYQADGTQLYDGTLPVYRLEGVNLFTYQPPSEATPTATRAPLHFGSSQLTLDVPVSALGGSVIGMTYQVQMYSLVPVDPMVSELQAGASYSGTLGDGSTIMTNDHNKFTPTAPTSVAQSSWGSLKTRYR